LSRDTQEKRAELLRELARELRQLNAFGASFFRAAAARIGMTVTDLQVIDILDSAGPATAGQLAELTGLTTGAITGMLNRLEEAGLVHRERDPEDGRRVIVRLAPGTDTLREINALFDAVARAWDEITSRYDDEQIAFLLEFLQRGSALSSKELARLREAPRDEEGLYAAPLGTIESGRLVVPAGISRLTLRAGADMAELYQARFEGSVPDVKTKDGVVTIRYPRRLWLLGGGQGTAEITLSAAIPWRIEIQGGASEITAELGGLNLAGLEMKGGMSMIRLELPVPSGVVPIRISGGASTMTVRRPVGVPARVHLKGWASAFVFDDQRFSYLGNDVRLQSPDYDATTAGYDIEVAGSASMVTISSE
jgi:DNA-binding MarR family transcriptional regulator